MNEIISNGLMNQLDVLRKYLFEDYAEELNGGILAEDIYHRLANSVLDAIMEIQKWQG